MKSYALRISALAIFLGGFGSVAGSMDAERPLFFTPSASGKVEEVVAALNGAKASIHMTMYNLTDLPIIDALIAAKNRGVEVKYIMDKTSAERKVDGPFSKLVAAGIDARKSSPIFSLTHSKSFTVDGERAYVMTLNLTKISDRVRDVALITSNPDDVKFVEELFAMDWQNSADGVGNSPSVIPENFVVAPVNAKAKILGLINSAKTSLKVVVENLSHDEIMQAMIDAKKRGVDVQVVLPRCNLSTPDFDMPAALKLNAGGVTVKLMQGPDSPDQPYIHEKAIVVDGTKGFLGSENFSFNSLEHARELGIIFADPNQVKQLSDVFDQDFAKSLDYAAAVAYTCPPSHFPIVMDEDGAL